MRVHTVRLLGVRVKVTGVSHGPLKGFPYICCGVEGGVSRRLMFVIVAEVKDGVDGCAWVCGSIDGCVAME